MHPMNLSSSAKKAYVCQQCGSVTPKWKGKCDECHQWDTLVVETVSISMPTDPSHAFETLSQADEHQFPRLSTGMAEFDRVCGGGIVAGSVSLVAGDPGIGKSTLLLQLAGMMAPKTAVVYVSGEESSAQIRLRAKRLGLQDANVHIISTNQLDTVLPMIPKVLVTGVLRGFIIIDSIQTMMLKSAGATPGTLGQIRECINTLITLAKSTGLAIMVDTVLYFEGDNNRPYRLLRTIKNRFGATHEVGVFDMVSGGLREVTNPSALFISPRQQEIPGACIFAGMEGTRPLLVEFQALSTPSFLASPRRSVVGWDSNRLSMILAVLEARCQLCFSKKDVFLTVLGGIRITEPAADLCVALALLSCLKKRPLPKRAIAFGEIGLTGEIYPTAFGEHRLREAEQLGFSHVFMPDSALSTHSMTLTSLNHVKDLDLWFRS